MKLHHYGFATKSIEKSVNSFAKLGYKPLSEKIVDTIQGVELQFINNEYDHQIELVAPIPGNTESPVGGVLKKSGSSLYHICYEVDDINSTIGVLEEKSFIVVLPPTPAIAFNNREISFLYNRHTGLIELLQK